ncbi:MAG: helix-turn-helix domain-containing protein, partial [Dermatophilaceae bacterium]
DHALAEGIRLPERLLSGRDGRRARGIQLALEGDLYERIAEELDVHVTSVRNWLRDYAHDNDTTLPEHLALARPRGRPSSGDGSSPRTTREQALRRSPRLLGRAKELHEAGIAPQDIADQLGLPADMVAPWLEEFRTPLSSDTRDLRRRSHELAADRWTPGEIALLVGQPVGTVVSWLQQPRHLTPSYPKANKPAEVVRRAIDRVMAGESRASAYEEAGVSDNTLDTWLQWFGDTNGIRIPGNHLPETMRARAAELAGSGLGTSRAVWDALRREYPQHPVSLSRLRQWLRDDAPGSLPSRQTTHRVADRHEVIRAVFEERLGYRETRDRTGVPRTTVVRWVKEHARELGIDLPDHLLRRPRANTDGASSSGTTSSPHAPADGYFGMPDHGEGSPEDSTDSSSVTSTSNLDPDDPGTNWTIRTADLDPITLFDQWSVIDLTDPDLSLSTRLSTLVGLAVRAHGEQAMASGHDPECNLYLYNAARWLAGPDGVIDPRSAAAAGAGRGLSAMVYLGDLELTFEIDGEPESTFTRTVRETQDFGELLLLGDPGRSMDGDGEAIAYQGGRGWQDELHPVELLPEGVTAEQVRLVRVGFGSYPPSWTLTEVPGAVAIEFFEDDIEPLTQVPQLGGSGA